MKGSRAATLTTQPFLVAARSLLLLTATLWRLEPVACQSTCPNDSSTTGFSTITELNTVMQNELDAIAAGATPQPPYTFVLCPSTVFDVATEGPLLPVLDQTTFTCGDPGSSVNSCVFDGGDAQVSIQDSTVAGFPLGVVTFQGATFRGFNTASSTIAASDVTSVVYDDTIWQNFVSTTVVDTTATPPATVDIRNSMVMNGQSAAPLFTNSGGSLTVDGIEISGTTAPVFINSDGSTANTIINNAIIRDNTASGTDFAAVQASNRASTSVSNSMFLRNTGMQFGVAGFVNAVVDISSSTFKGNSAVNPTDRQSLVGAYNSASVAISDTTFVDNNNYLGFIFSIFDSFVGGSNIDITGGQTILPIYVSEFSTHDFIFVTGSNIDAVICAPPMMDVIFKEDPGSNCFGRSMGHQCAGTCVASNDNAAPSAPVSAPASIPSAPFLPSPFVPTLPHAPAPYAPAPYMPAPYAPAPYAPAPTPFIY